MRRLILEFIYLTIGVLLVCTGCRNASSNRPTACPHNRGEWEVWLADGKSDTISVDLLEAKEPLENYEANLALIHPWEFGGYGSTKDMPHNPKVTPIGIWCGYMVYDITDKAQVIKQIMLKDMLGNHLVLYSQIPSCTGFVEALPYVTIVDGVEILAYRTRLPGTGGFYLQYYFVEDPNTHLPVNLDMTSIGEPLKQILPEQHHIERGSGFDVETLTYENSVWKEGDGGCQPTGGNVEIRFRIEGTNLVPVYSNYQPLSRDATEDEK